MWAKHNTLKKLWVSTSQAESHTKKNLREQFLWKRNDSVNVICDRNFAPKIFKIICSNYGMLYAKKVCMNYGTMIMSKINGINKTDAESARPDESLCFEDWLGSTRVLHTSRSHHLRRVL